MIISVAPSVCQLYFIFSTLACLYHMAESGCILPITWRGNWFQKGIHPTMEIGPDSISTKGKCLESGQNGRFLFHDPKLNCVRCLLILQRHYNVLQYRQTYCFQRGKLDDICKRLNSDENLHSMFRADAKPIACPFIGSYAFAYNSGGLAECSNPMSSAERCADQSELLLRFQACADVKGTESRVEKLTCLATWKDGLLSYVIGKMEHALVSSDNDRYRCFVYEKLKRQEGVLRISQSPDATCYGLDHSNAGSRIMKFIKVKDESSRCKFPQWVTSSHRHWETLDMSHSYVFSHKNKSLYIRQHPVFNKLGKDDDENSIEDVKRQVTKVKCIQEYSNQESVVTYIVHVTSGCSNGYQCMRIYRRQPHIIQITRGKIIRNKGHACLRKYMESYETEIVTLVEAAHTRHSRCPNFVQETEMSVTVLEKKLESNSKRLNDTKKMSKSGNALSKSKWHGWKTNRVTKSIRQRREVCGEFSTARLACQHGHTLNFQFDCAEPIPDTKYNCHGHWQENGITYLVTTVYGSNKKICLAYSSHNGRINVSARNNCVVSHHGNVKGVRTLFSVDAHVSDSCRGAGNTFTNTAYWTFFQVFIIFYVYTIICR